MRKVEWVAGRLKGLARAVALETAKAQGKAWQNMTEAQREKAMRDAEAVVRGWVHNQVLATFESEYREPEGGGPPMVEWDA